MARYAVQTRHVVCGRPVWRTMTETNNPESADTLKRQCERLGDTARIFDKESDK